MDSYVNDRNNFARRSRRLRESPEQAQLRRERNREWMQRYRQSGTDDERLSRQSSNRSSIRSRQRRISDSDWEQNQNVETQSRRPKIFSR